MKFWWHAFSASAFIINLLPSSIINNSTPYFLLHKKQPDYAFLKVFGCACFPYLRPYNSSKLQFRSSKCIFLGYCSSHKGYLCLHPTGRIYISPTVDLMSVSFYTRSYFPHHHHHHPITHAYLSILSSLAYSLQLVIPPHIDPFHLFQLNTHPFTLLITLQMN